MAGESKASPRKRAVETKTQSVPQKQGQNPNQGLAVPVPKFVSNMYVKNSGGVQLEMSFDQDPGLFPLEPNESIPVALQFQQQQVVRFKGVGGQGQVSYIFW